MRFDSVGSGTPSSWDSLPLVGGGGLLCILGMTEVSGSWNALNVGVFRRALALDQTRRLRFGNVSSAYVVGACVSPCEMA